MTLPHAVLLPALSCPFRQAWLGLARFPTRTTLAKPKPDLFVFFPCSVRFLVMAPNGSPFRSFGCNPVLGDWFSMASARGLDHRKNGGGGVPKWAGSLGWVCFLWSPFKHPQKRDFRISLKQDTAKHGKAPRDTARESRERRPTLPCGNWTTCWLDQTTWWLSFGFLFETKKQGAFSTKRHTHIHLLWGIAFLFLPPVFVRAQISASGEPSGGRRLAGHAFHGGLSFWRGFDGRVFAGITPN